MFISACLHLAPFRNGCEAAAALTENILCCVFNGYSFLKKLRLKNSCHRTDNLSVLLTRFTALLMPVAGILSQAVQVNSNTGTKLSYCTKHASYLQVADIQLSRVPCILCLEALDERRPSDVSQLPPPCDAAPSAAPG